MRSLIEIPSMHWITKHYTQMNEWVNCNQCVQKFQIFEDIEKFKQHVFDKHPHHEIITIYNREYLWHFFYITEYNMVKCRLCDAIYPMKITENVALCTLKKHVLNYHVNYDNRSITEWLTQNYEITGFDAKNRPTEKRCEVCGNNYFGPLILSYFLLMHLIVDHNLVPPNAMQYKN